MSIAWVRSVAFTGAAISLLALGGCGGGGSSENGIASKSANEILTATGKAADAATSVHVSGQLTSGSERLTLDLDLQAGKGGRGQVAEKGLSFELISLGSTLYIKGSPAFYKKFAGNAAAQLFQGKWLKAPSNSGELAELGSLTDLHKLIEDVLVGHGKLAKGATSTVNGQKAVAINDTTKGGTLYVAATGTPYPIQISKTGSEAGIVKFENWNKPVTLKAPSGAIDLSQLQSGGH